MILSIEEARESYVGRPVDGWTCSCGKCSGEAGVILAIEDQGYRIGLGPWGFICEVGKPGHEHGWSTGLHSLFPEAEAAPPAEESPTLRDGGGAP